MLKIETYDILITERIYWQVITINIKLKAANRKMEKKIKYGEYTITIPMIETFANAV
jgi:hypothetical protein